MALAQQYTVADLLDAYTREYLPHQAPTTQRRKQYQFVVIREALGDIALTGLTAGRLRTWRDALSQQASPGTVMTYLHTLGAALTVAARDYEWLTGNPMTKVHKPTLSPERVRFLDQDEQRRLLGACQRSPCRLLYPLVLLALTTGCRKMECLMLRWADVDLAQGVVRLERTKTRLKRGVPMPQITAAVFQQWQTQASSLYVFPGVRSQPPDITRRWRWAVARAGLEDFHFHDLRHTAASYLAMSGVRIEDIAEILGHKNLQTTRRYRHLSPVYTAALVEKMAQQFIARGT